MFPGLTPYQYAYNNPISYNDPSGLIAIPALLGKLWTGIKAIAGVKGGSAALVSKTAVGGAAAAGPPTMHAATAAGMTASASAAATTSLMLTKGSTIMLFKSSVGTGALNSTIQSGCCEGLIEFKNDVLEFGAGIGNAWISNNTTITGPTDSYSLIKRQSPTSRAFGYGQTIGDGLSIIQGVGETVWGATVTTTGTISSLTGVGAIYGAPATSIGTAATAHGANTFANGLNNFGNKGRYYSKGKTTGKTITDKSTIEKSITYKKVNPKAKPKTTNGVDIDKLKTSRGKAKTPKNKKSYNMKKELLEGLGKLLDHLQD
ncbi:MAG: hypothetical protein ACFB0B_13355 [Thermonemataceae bacterium]